MRTTLFLGPGFGALRGFVERLPERFAAGPCGEVLHAGRNTVAAFAVGDERLVVKRYERCGVWRGIVYGLFRRSKARRAYEHAVRLRALGIGTPEPVAWVECRRRGLLRDAYSVTRRSDRRPLSRAAEAYPDPGAAEVLDAVARFAARLHEAGVCHDDFNHGNILWDRDPATGDCRFELIDINRMRFFRRPLSARRSMVSLRRLSCPPEAFLYLLDRYARHRGRSVEETLLGGLLLRLLFVRRKRFKRRLRERHRALRAKK